MKGLNDVSRPVWKGQRRSKTKGFVIRVASAILMMGMFLVLWLVWVGVSSAANGTCNTVNDGYNCFSKISHSWGQYSPYFSLEKESAIPGAIPSECRVTFVQALSRHGARYPTSSKGGKYSNLVAEVQQNASETSLTGKYAFLKNYKYTLGTDTLTTFGEYQLVDSGRKFYQRYSDLARQAVPFIRASGSARVIASGKKFIQGFDELKGEDPHARRERSRINVVISENDYANNTLDHTGLCPVFENDGLEKKVEANFTAIYAPPIRERLEKDLAGVKLTDDDVVYLMDMCSFDTVARTPDASELSPFCNLFTHEEWVKYDYSLSLAKYYGYGSGNPLGPTQGVGYVNELIARLTQTPVQDHTTSNHTLDSNPATFPLNATLYADFGHDNGMIPILFALGLYNGTAPLDMTEAETTQQTNGYSAAWLVPFGARAYVEMMQCGASELVRVLVNDRVVPLHGCKADELQRCTRDDFVNGLSFARGEGNWAKCYS